MADSFVEKMFHCGDSPGGETKLLAGIPNNYACYCFLSFSTMSSAES